MALATGPPRKTIHFGIRALKAEAAAPNQALPADRIRRGGGGRKPMTHTQPKRVAALDARVEPTSRGDPQSPRRWTCKRTRRLGEALRRQGFRVRDRKVAAWLEEANDSLQSSRCRHAIFPFSSLAVTRLNFLWLSKPWSRRTA